MVKATLKKDTAIEWYFDQDLDVSNKPNSSFPKKDLHVVTYGPLQLR